MHEVDETRLLIAGGILVDKNTNSAELFASFPVDDSLIYAVRLIVDGRLDSETDDGRKVALVVLEAEKAARSRDQDIGKKRKAYFQAHVDKIKRDIERTYTLDTTVDYAGMSSKGLDEKRAQLRRMRDIYAYITEIEHAINDIHAQNNIKKFSETITGGDDDDFEGFQIPERG